MIRPEHSSQSQGPALETLYCLSPNPTCQQHACAVKTPHAVQNYLQLPMQNSSHGCTRLSMHTYSQPRIISTDTNHNQFRKPQLHCEVHCPMTHVLYSKQHLLPVLALQLDAWTPVQCPFPAALQLTLRCMLHLQHFSCIQSSGCPAALSSPPHTRPLPLQLPIYPVLHLQLT